MGSTSPEATQKLIKEGDLEFTIDQQPYQQGFLPIAAAVLLARLRVADAAPRTWTRV